MVPPAELALNRVKGRLDIGEPHAIGEAFAAVYLDLDFPFQPAGDEGLCHPSYLF